MKLVRYGEAGHERPGVLAEDGTLRDLSTRLTDIDAEAISPGTLKSLTTLEPGELPVVDGEPRLGPPIVGVGKFLAIGLNYSDHAEESNMPIPDEPIVFMKTPNCIVGAFDQIAIPIGSKKTDWEVELGIVIGSMARHVSEVDALSHVAGYLTVHDVSEREFQLERGGQWDKGKGCDTFGPIGPWLVTADEIADPQSLDLWLDVNGERKQTGNTSKMIFSCAELVSYVSRFMTLLPGDIITTGTPPGVGMGASPPQYLAPGDIVTLGISGLGEQRQEAVAYETWSKAGD